MSRREAPPTFIVVAKDDPVVQPENSVRYHDALQKVGVSSELHAFAEGGHGFGIRDARQQLISDWPNLAAARMKANGTIKAAPWDGFEGRLSLGQ